MTCHQLVDQAAVLSDVPPPLNAPRERYLVTKSSTNLGPVDLSSCSSVCNTVLSFQEYFAIDFIHFS